MNKHKRLLSLVLVAAMVFGMFPMTASAEDENTGHIETCAGDCTGEACTCTCHQPAVVDDEPVDTCENCGQPDCTGCDGTVAQTEGETEPAPGCTVCGQAEGHLQTCSQYVAPTEETTEPATSSTEKTTEPTTVPTEETTEPSTEATQPSTGATEPSSEATGPAVLCGKCEATLAEDGKTVVHAQGCTAVCNCTPTGDVHQPYCNLYVVPKCSHCGVELTEGAVHGGNCPQYVAEGTENDAPQVGDKIWIKSGSKLYKGTDDTDGYAIKLPYHVKVKEIKTLGETVWYQFEFADLSAIIGSIFLKDYKWVKAENTSVEEPTEPEETVPSCDCINPPEDLSLHADSCPRKIYVKTLFEGKTAEEIYADWESYDEDLRLDILNMVKAYDEEMYEELNVLVNCTCGTEDGIHGKDCPFYYDGGFDTVYVEYAATSSNGVSANITAPEGAFPEGTTVAVTDTEVSLSQVKSVVDGTIKGIVAIDISFGGEQPSEAVTVTMDIPASKIPDDANMVIVVHMGSNGPEVMGIKYLDTTDDGETIAFATNGFSSYAAVFVNGKYNAQKMSSALAGNGRYQISTFNVDLFDYDPVKMNNALNSATSDGKGFHLTGYGIEGMGSNSGINNSASTHAKQGILGNSLVNGFPVINFLNGANAGETTGKILFSDSYAVDGKTLYNDIPFEFIYDNQTGYYEYKSSVNHAQLNEAGTKIELYADTLSTENSYVATLNLGTANGISDYSSNSASTNSYSGIVEDSNNNDRLDPYVVFTVDNVKASGVGQIYVKAKVPASVGANYFQLFFTTNNDAGWSEAKSFGNAEYSEAIPYTANGDWIEFVIDTSENANWKDSITGVRVDLFDSNKGTLNVNGSYSVEISEIRMIRKDYDAYATRGGFYPFSEIQDSYPGNNTAFNLNTWEKNFLNDNLSMARASRSIFNPAPSSETLRYNELAFGTVIEFDFYLPVDKTGLDGNPLTYYFNGDDDLWVFVDNQLVLDIGGGHGAVTGKVNFSEGTWNVEQAITVTGYNSGADGSYGPKSGSLSSQLYSAGKHTMKIFYLERGGSVSNCFMKFNLPRTPQGSVVVSKDVVEVNDANNSELLEAEFEFQIEIKNNGTGDNQAKTPLANTDYYIVASNGDSLSGKTDSNGKFTLKSGEKAYFNIDENYDVTVTETKRDVTDHKWISTTVNNETGFTLTQLTVDGQEKLFAFVNTYERLFGNLVIKKTGISSLDHNSNETQSTIYIISGRSNEGEEVYLEVTIAGNSQKMINHIPVGTYTVTEKVDWSWRYEPESNGQSVTVAGGETAETAFENDRTEIYWLSGDSYCENWWGGDSGTVVCKDKA